MNEEEQLKELDMRWKILKDQLHLQGVDTSNDRLLLSMKTMDPLPLRFAKKEIFEFKIGSPDRGLVSIDRLILDCRAWLPEQSVNGLLCITTTFPDDAAFLIYNPITGERSTNWIKINRKPYNDIAFGFDPKSGEHKVIWISGAGSENCDDQVVEVYTVGKNTWRRIDATPPISIGYEVPYYVHGCLYWRFREGFGELELLMRFDIVAEKFRVIPIPDYVIDPERHKWSQTVVLTEIDGRIAVLDWICELDISLWTIHEDADDNIEWTEEIIDMPANWNGESKLSFVALMGTNQIFIRPEDSDYFFYYNRDTKKSVSLELLAKWVPFDLERIIQV